MARSQKSPQRNQSSSIYDFLASHIRQSTSDLYEINRLLTCLNEIAIALGDEKVEMLDVTPDYVREIYQYFQASQPLPLGINSFRSFEGNEFAGKSSLAIKELLKCGLIEDAGNDRFYLAGSGHQQ